MSHLHVVDDEDAELDAMAARDAEPVHTDQGYADTLAPRGRRRAAGPTYFRIVEVEGVEPARAAATKVCRKCNEPTAILHQHPKQPDSPERTICGRCQGEIRREMNR